jgi:membrane fusion protein, heavy metal efflux system
MWGMRKLKRSAFAALAGVALAGGLSGFYFAGQQPAAQEARAQTTDQPGSFRPSEQQWASLKTTPVTAIEFQTAKGADGKIATDDYKATSVFSPYSGRVTRFFAQPGDEVKAGTPLFALEATEFVQAHNDLAAAIAALNKARAQLSQTTVNEKRQHDLYDVKAAAMRDWEQAKTDLTAASADLRSAEANLTSVRNRLKILGRTDEEIAALETSSSINPEVTVKAPIGGTVISRKIGIGQYIQAAAPDPVFTIGDLSTVWLIANVRESDIPNVALGQKATVSVLAYPGRVFNATITYIAPSIDPNTHRLPVRAEVNNPGNALKPEMFAAFSILSGEGDTAPAVPQDSVVYEGDQAHVWVVDDERRISSRSIRVGRTSGDWVEVLSGLSTGEKVISSGALFIDRAMRADAGPLPAGSRA